MLRTLTGAAIAHGRPSILLEPIALYMTKDLHEDGDGGWLTPYPDLGDSMPVGEVGVYGDGNDLCLATWANGLYMSLRVAERLRRTRGWNVRVIDLRWLQPLPLDALMPHIEACGKLLMVDECRASSGIANAVCAEVAERRPRTWMRRVTGADSYVPLGAAANLVLVQEADIEAGIVAMLQEDP
jgi:2-oxoisovalerate dehydrogenase E1 component